jgi:uncharacterized protein (TIGR03435 family)
MGLTSLKLTTSIGFVLAAAIGMAQSQNAAPVPHSAFEVASIKPAAPGGRGMGIGFRPGAGVSAQNVPLRFLMRVAYDVKEFQVINGAPWTNTERYDITAKGEDGTPQSQIKLMLQALLADRFKLAFHRETRDMPVFFLTPAKGGIKLVEPKEGSCVTPDPTAPPPAPAPGQPPPKFCGNMRISPQDFNGTKISMMQLTAFLSDVLGRTVIDKTDFKSTFDAHLEFARDQALASGILGNGGLGGPGGTAAETADSSGPSIFTAVQEQLGVKLESGKGPVEVFVIDSAEKPGEN